MLVATPMKQTYLGRTGISVSPLCLGTMTFGREADSGTSRAILDRALEAGVNFIDCANVYAGTQSEQLLGELLEGRRESVVLTSKCGFPVAGGPEHNNRGLSRLHICRAVEDSLRRLRTDHLDIYFTHYLDANVPVEDLVRTMDDLVRAGKIRHWGISNWAAWEVMKALGIADRHGWVRPACLQPMYNLVKRQAEVEIFPMALAENVGIISYNPLGGGLLTGKHTWTERADESRLSSHEMYMKRYGQEWMYQVAAAFKQLADERGAHPVTLAVAWALRHPAVTAPILGARSVEQLDPALAAAEFAMDDELYESICALSPKPPSATDR
ncbi:MAG: aldo/keto reductase [Opitutales bacterium]